MRELFGWTVGYTKSPGPKLEYQVAVAIGVVLCATFFCNAYIAAGKPPSQPTPVVAPEARADLLKANFTDDGFRSRPASAVEFAAVYGHAERSYTALAAQWSAPSPSPSKAQDAPVAKVQKKATLLAQACSGDCVTSSLPGAAVVPPRRPADLAPAPIALASAPVPAEEKRVRLLGVSLPGFVPSGDTIAKTVVSWGGSIVDAIPGL
jgi:hypothetical protein